MPLFAGVSDAELVERQVALEKEIAELSANVDALAQQQRPGDLRTMKIVSDGNRRIAGLTEQHTLVIGCLDRRGVRYPNWERYNK